MISCLVFTYGQINIHEAQAHLEHLPHYNAGESRIGYGDYMSFMALDPDYGTTDHPTTITFSIQDFDGNDVYNVWTMVEIYDSITGKRVHAFPWTFRDVGDFNLYYQFPKKRGVPDSSKCSQSHRKTFIILFNQSRDATLYTE